MPINLAQYDDISLPADLLADTDHPANDAFMLSVNNIQRRIVAHCQTMPRTHPEIVRLVHQGLNNEEIRNRTGRSNTPAIMKKPASKRLLALLQHYQTALDGPNIAQRRNMLWRIAQREEIDGPKTAISALAELNRSDTALQPLEQGRSGGQTVITINQNILPRGKLDEEEVIDVQ